MRSFVFWVLLTGFWAVLVLRSFSAEGSTLSVPDFALTHHGSDVAVMTRSRKLKEQYGYSLNIYHSSGGRLNLEDYNPIDPVPSSKASIRPGPIEHGTPLMPYIPKPSPPDHPVDAAASPKPAF
ncbi:hypothetical protein NMG60_11031232 [Bertholletia excelsa]